MVAGIRDLSNSHELLWAWTQRTVKARYQQSLLGGAWAVLQPAASAIIFSIIFTRVVPIDTGGVPYLVFSYVALVPWTLFSGSVADMVDSLTGNMNLISKIYFPREVLPFSAMMARLLDFAIAFTILLIVMLFYRMPIFTVTWLWLPLILLVQLLFTAGIGLVGAALNVFYRDIRHLFGLILQLWLYASPIIYPVTAIPPQFQPLYFLNPMAGILTAYRSVILHSEPPGPYFWLATVISIVVFIGGYWFFRRVQRRFADVV